MKNLFNTHTRIHSNTKEPQTITFKRVELNPLVLSFFGQFLCTFCISILNFYVKCYFSYFWFILRFQKNTKKKKNRKIVLCVSRTNIYRTWLLINRKIISVIYPFPNNSLFLYCSIFLHSSNTLLITRELWNYSSCLSCLFFWWISLFCMCVCVCAGPPPFFLSFLLYFLCLVRAPKE